ncbi:MAG: DegT/DnrJ/EryC1/StrS family aminotransferase [Magnetococcales bacterium]|nr:DegT/DnrJ/EryC1/StrS family aminotransferase [Magnetococcales bacterium]NGZ06249.1 DegT/DnrJ/EryC1/StrS family aminotransferase [Magnetococcales bacterium]
MNGSRRENFLVFGKPVLEEAEIEEVVDTLRSGWLGTGPKTTRFENAFKEYKNASHAVAVNSCTAALHLSLLVAGIGPGDEVITTAMTFCATINAIIYVGATPVLVDIDSVTCNLDPEQVVARMTERTRAIVPVHFGGYPCDMERLEQIAHQYGLILIEDCAHAIETEYYGRKAGTIGAFGCFSFYVTKNLTTGEGGMVLTRRPEDAERVRTLALHGLSQDAWKRFGNEGFKPYQVIDLGYKYNMTDIQAALGIHQLRRIERNWQRRRQIWSIYQEGFASCPVGRPADPPSGIRHGYHLYALQWDEQRIGMSRVEFLHAMRMRNIGTSVHYQSIPCHPYYQDRFGWSPEEYPVAARMSGTTVSLPMSAGLSDQDVWDVIGAVRQIIAEASAC